MLEQDEVIVLPLPATTAAMIAAADAYLAQYGVVAHLAIRGMVQLEGGQIARIPVWRSIARFDRELDPMGLGDLGDYIG